MASVDPFIDPAALMRVKSLELRARMVMEGFWKGLHRSPYHGFSVEFSEYRPYSRGDDPRHIDWKVMARTDRSYLKKFEDETNLRAHLLLDFSRSMTFAGSGFPKSEYAATLAATLAFFLMKQNDAVGLTTFDRGVIQHIPARNRAGHLRRLMLCLEHRPSGEGTDLANALKGALEIIRKRSLVILISDLLAPLDDLERRLGHWVAEGHEMMVVQVLDARELSFDFSSPMYFQDAESGRDLYIDPKMAREPYLERLNAHLEAVRHVCGKNGMAYRLVSTAEPLEQVLFDLVSTRQRKS